MSTPDATVGTAPAEAVEGFSVRRALSALARGDLPSLRVLLGIVVIWSIFQIANDRSLSAVNLSNLTLQIAAVATIPRLRASRATRGRGRSGPRPDPVTGKLTPCSRGRPCGRLREPPSELLTRRGSRATGLASIGTIGRSLDTHPT